MIHSEVCEQAKIWHHTNFPDRTIHPNRTGVARFLKKIINKIIKKISDKYRFIPYGFPAPSMRKKLRKATGGGPDFYSIGAENGVCSLWGIECKTLKKKTLQKNQILWANYMVSQGARYYIATETEAGGVEYSRYYPDGLSPGDPTPP